jgi:hypothetical protein
MSMGPAFAGRPHLSARRFGEFRGFGSSRSARESREPREESLPGQHFGLFSRLLARKHFFEALPLAHAESAKPRRRPAPRASKASHRRGKDGKPVEAERRYAAAFKISAAFSPTMIEGALVLPDGMVGKIEASAMRRPSMPCTLSLSSTTVLGPAGPMRQVPIGW